MKHHKFSKKAKDPLGSSACCNADLGNKMCIGETDAAILTAAASYGFFHRKIAGLKIAYIFHTLKTNMEPKKIPPWKRRNIYKTNNFWVPCLFWGL